MKSVPGALADPTATGWSSLSQKGPGEPAPAEPATPSLSASAAAMDPADPPWTITTPPGGVHVVTRP